MPDLHDDVLVAAQAHLVRRRLPRPDGDTRSTSIAVLLLVVAMFLVEQIFRSGAKGHVGPFGCHLLRAELGGWLETGKDSRGRPADGRGR